MRPVIVVLLAAVSAAALVFADYDGGGGDPALSPVAEPAQGRLTAPAPKTVILADSASDEAKLRGLVEDATRWLLGSAAGKPTMTLPWASLADAIRAGRQAGPAGNGSGALAFGGGWAAGVVIAPEQHPDARPWPLGMVIHPGNTKDPMVIPPGCDGLPPLPPNRVDDGWRKPFADLARAADADDAGACPKVKVL